MLNKNRSGKLARLKYLTVLPLCAGMLCASTLAFAKDYGWVDLMPKSTIIEKPMAILPDAKDTTKPKLSPPPPPTYLKKSFESFGWYISATAKYPKEALDKKLNGSVVLSFNVDAKGKITDVKAIKNPGNGFFESLIKSINNYPDKINEKAGNYLISFNFNMLDTDNFISGSDDRKITSSPGFVGEIDVQGLTDGQRKRLPPPPAPPVPPVKKLSKVKFPLPRTMVKPDKVTSANKLLAPPYYLVYRDLMKYVAKSVRYPTAARDKKLTGNVLVNLKLDDAHKITDIKVINGIGSGCDEEVIRALKSFKGVVSQTPDNYSLMVSFALTAENGTKQYYLEPIPSDIAVRTDFIGRVIVMGYVPEEKPGTVTPAIIEKKL
jgi:outer membrane biosynthesis protein TonB